jgi:hypothetical protein
MKIPHLAGMMLAAAACGMAWSVPVQAQDKACNAATSNPLDYAGKYGLSNGSSLNIREADGRYFAGIDGTRPFEIFQTAPGRFEAKDRSFQLSFCGGRDEELDLVVELRPAEAVQRATFAQRVQESMERAQTMGASSAGSQAAGGPDRKKKMP